MGKKLIKIKVDYPLEKIVKYFEQIIRWPWGGFWGKLTILCTYLFCRKKGGIIFAWIWLLF